MTWDMYIFNSRLWFPLGYGNKTVDRAVQKQILEIDTGTGPSVRMVELAETLVKPKRSGNVWLFYLFIFLIKKYQNLKAKHYRIYKII